MIGQFETIDECAATCKGKTSFFGFCIYPGYCCDKRKCKCYCETGVPSSNDPKRSTCVLKDHGQFHVYWYQPKGNISFSSHFDYICALNC